MDPHGGAVCGDVIDPSDTRCFGTTAQLDKFIPPQVLPLVYQVGLA
jgi:hypothetical protein